MSTTNERSDYLVPLPRKELTDAADPAANDIGDGQFMADLKKVKELRSFLIEQAVQLKPTEQGTLSFGTLNLLRWKSGGRNPTQDEWQALEVLTQQLFRHLSDPLRRRFLYSRLPWWVTELVVALGCVAFLSLIACTFIWGQGGYARIIPLYVLWLASLGAIGSISFVGMNALSVQDDATFDLSNTRLLVLRISLGALFGVVLTLPFGFNSFTKFIDLLLQGASPTPEGSQALDRVTLQSLLLLLPFVLGFSTSLVILILNQFVDAIQSFFGKKNSPTGSYEGKIGQSVTSEPTPGRSRPLANVGTGSELTSSDDMAGHP